ncbi:MAG: helix-turn-helix domain-containing protein [Pseudomonadota bacterium]
MKSLHSQPYQALLTLLLEARRKAAITQTDLADKLGRPQSFVSKYERGERRLDVVEFLEVCRGIGADPYKLLKKIEGGSPPKG